MDPPPYLVLRVREQFFFQLVCIGSKKSPPISRVNKCDSLWEKGALHLKIEIEI